MWRLTWIALCSLFLFGCGGPTRYEVLQKTMPEYIGNWSIDDAINRYGLPTKQFELEGKTAYSWEQRSYRHKQAVNLWTGEPLPFSRTIEEGSELILFFKEGYLVDWKYREW